MHPNRGFTMPMRRPVFLWLVALVLLAVHAVGAGVAWRRLPDRIPIHFSFGGTPDAWADTSVLSWFGPVAIAGALLLLLYGVTARRTRTRPVAMGREPAMHGHEEPSASDADHGRLIGAVCAVCLACTLLAVQTAMYLVARGIAQTSPWYVELAIWAPMVLMIVSAVALSRHARRAAA